MPDELFSTQEVQEDGSVIEHLVCGCVRYIWPDIIRTDLCKKHAEERAKQNDNRRLVNTMKSMGLDLQR